MFVVHHQCFKNRLSIYTLCYVFTSNEIENYTVCRVKYLKCARNVMPFLLNSFE